MVRGRKAGLSIAELERMLARQKSAAQRLLRRRESLVQKLAAVDRELADLGGTAGRTPGGRVRNPMNLVEAMEAAMRQKPPMKVGDILDAVLGSGYQSSSANFRGIVNQTLIKDGRFVAVGRGLYRLEK